MSRPRRLAARVPSVVPPALAIGVACLLSLAISADARQPVARAQTTAPLGAIGPEDPEGGRFGLAHPRRFMLGVVPVSFGFTTADASWRGWGSPVATGTGVAEFNVIMTPPERVSYSLRLSRRRSIDCGGSGDHYSYEQVTIDIPDYRGAREDFSEPMYPGCPPPAVSDPARGDSSHRSWCEMFHVAYAVNTSCAVEAHVARLYGPACIPKGYRSGPLPPCRRILLGFHCKPAGDVYAVINCVDGRRRVGLHLAE